MSSGHQIGLPFFEAYFSNFIEATEFAVEEARQIVFDNVIPPTRAEDAHDVTGTQTRAVWARERAVWAREGRPITWDSWQAIRASEPGEALHDP